MSLSRYYALHCFAVKIVRSQINKTLSELTLDRPTWAFASASIGFGTLTPHWKTTTMAQATVATEIQQALDIHRHIATQITFHIQFCNLCPQRIHLRLIEITNTTIFGYFSRSTQILRGGSSNTEDIRQRNYRVLVIWYIDTSYTGHQFHSSL
jgi:hypothetical protein